MSGGNVPPLPFGGGGIMAEKRYFWLKLKDDFFDRKEIKKLRRIAGGDTYTIIYLKMLLLSTKNGGRLFYEGVEETLAEELALELDENTEDVVMVLGFLERYKMIEKGSSTEYLLPEAAKAIGSETKGAERIRRFREKQKTLQCNGDVTEVKRLCNESVTLDIDIEKEIDIYIAAERACAREEEAAAVIKTFSDNVHPISGEIERDKLIDLLERYGADWVCSAIKEAVECNGRNIRYIERILQAWEKRGQKGGGKRGGHKGKGGTSETAEQTAWDDEPDTL